MEIKLPRITDADILDISNEFENDLIAYYKLLETEVLNIIENSELDEIVNKVEDLFGG
jgi:hypothetical protein